LDGDKWKYQFVIDPTAERIIQQYGIPPERVETALSLAQTPEKRIAFQFFVQSCVDMGISSTINLPAWGSKHNNPDTAKELAALLYKYAPGLRGITCYPDGSRGGQPITEIPYEDAKGKKGTVYDESEERCLGGVCGV
jgi:ribonucleoside-diphosphate reductase alpha chain